MKYIIYLMLFMLLLSCDNKSEEEPVNANLNPNTERTDSLNNDSNLTTFKILSVSEGLFENAPALQINFSLPVGKKQNISQLINVSLKNSESVNGDWIIGKDRLVLYFPFIDAEKNYVVTVNDMLLSSTGRQIDKAYSQNIHTSPQQQMVKFASKGNTMLSDSNELPIEAVNVSAVDMKFWRVRPDKYHQFLEMSERREIYYLENLNKIADLIFTGQFALAGVKNKTEIHNISIKDIKEVQQAGVYFVTMSPADKYSYELETIWFSVTDIGLHTRFYSKSLVVFAHKVPQGEVYAGVELTILDGNGKQLGNTKTDSQGFAEFKTSELDKAKVLIARRGNNSNLIYFDKPKMDLSEFALSSRQYKPQELFLYAPRNLFRPGEKVNINGLLRNADGQLVKASPIRVEIKRPDNRTFKSLDWLGDEDSFYSTEFTIPADAMTGRWAFKATLANNDEFEYQFSVEDFLPERLKLDLTTGNDSLQVLATEIPSVKIQSDYLYGAPAASNRYDASVILSAANNLFDTYDDFVFGSNSYKEYDLDFTTESGQLNEQGFAEIKLITNQSKVNWQGTKYPLRIKSYVNVYESGGRPISRSITHTVWPYPTAVGIRPLWDGDYASPNSNSEIELVAINQQGQQLEMMHVEVLLIRENSQRYWHWGETGWDYANSSNNLPVHSTVINLPANKKTRVSLPLNYGSYRVEIRNKQRQLLSSYQFFSGWSWYDQNNASGERPDQVKLAWQVDDLLANNNAELIITAPYTGTALITVESDKLLWKKSIQMKKAQEIVSIPIDKNWNRHDIHASVMVIRKGEIKRKNLPSRYYGVIHLPLNRDDQKLNLSINHPEKVIPDQTVVIELLAEKIDPDKDTYVTLAAVDTGVLSVSNYKTPRPFDWFFAKRKYNVALRDIYGSLIALSDGKHARQKFGGDADLNRGGEAANSDVQIVSLMSEKVQFDAEGKAEISLQLPYFNGELRLMALAFNDNQFAGSDSRMKVAAPVVIEASLPRFLAKGDKSFATVEVHNTESFQQEIELEFISDDVLGGYNETVDMVLSNNEKKIIKLPITGEIHQGTGYVNVSARVKGKLGYKFDRKWGLGLRPAFPAIINTTKTVIEAGESFAVSAELFEKFSSQNLKSVLKVSNILVLNEAEHLHQLIQYPYGCLEQTSSRAWPLLLAEKSDFELFKSTEQNKIFANRNNLIDQAISRILGMQRYDGGFGMWSSDDPEQNWLSVYATDFLLRAKSKGYNISEQAINKAIKRLQFYVKGQAGVSSDLGQYLSSKENYLLSYQAYAAYVLSRIKQLGLQDVRKLYDNNQRYAKSPLPLAYLASSLEQMGDERRSREAWMKAIDFEWNQDRYSYYGDYGSKIRDLSQVIELGLQSHLLKNLPKTSYQLLTPLQDSLKQRNWLSTQERAALFRVAKSLKEAHNASDEWSMVLAREDKTNEFRQSNDLTKIWRETQAKLNFNLNNSGEKSLYIDFKFQGYLLNHASQSHGITVQRNYYNLQGNSLDVNNLNSGDMVLVHLKISLDEKYSYLPDAMVIELIPAGLELENQNLEHSLKLDEIKIDGKYIKDWLDGSQIKHSEYRDDRFVSAMALSAYSDNHLFYLARAVSPGEYVIPPTLVEDMYRPEIRAIGKSEGMLKVNEK
ncbi:MAG: alpha-2-macroglobulin family protein [Proteobacteria bacterium]|nr:alpha-2-macroglobulin family protein [Pseudomonadota bacterium]